MSLRPSPLVAMLGVLSSAPAAAAIQCGNHLVSEGDTAAELEVRCGPPASVDRRLVQRPPVIWRYGRPLRLAGDDFTVEVEYWLYNFGSNKLLRRVRIEDGRVREIETLGYGYP